MLRADVRTPPEAEALNVLVGDIRATVHRGGRDGLRVAVTGPAAAVADAERVFERIDLRLYAGALALVMLLLVLCTAARCSSGCRSSRSAQPS